jgi:hypothetical protein
MGNGRNQNRHDAAPETGGNIRCCGANDKPSGEAFLFEPQAFIAISTKRKL